MTGEYNDYPLLAAENAGEFPILLGDEDLVDALTDSEATTKFQDCTLRQYNRARQLVSARWKAICAFIGSVETKSLTNTAKIYQHTLLQYSFPNMLKKLNYRIVREIAEIDNAIVPAVKTEIKCSSVKTFEAYENATIFCEHLSNGHRLIVSVNKHHNFYSYIVRYTDLSLNLWEKWQKISEQKNFYKGQKIDYRCNFLRLNNTLTWNSVILPEKTKTLIQRHVETSVKLQKILKKNKISTKRGIIFYGPPGTGKTVICKVLASESKATVLYILPSHIESVADIEMICMMARQLAPTLLIFEDIDYLAQDRGQYNNPVVVELMNRLDGLEEMEDVVTLATTNYIEKVEKAVRNRPGRFDRTVHIPLPDDKGREAMFQAFTSNWKIEEFDVSKFVTATKGMSGAYIKHVCEAAAALALDEGSFDKDEIAIVKLEHFRSVIKELKDKDSSEFAHEQPKRSMGFVTDEKSDDDF